MDYYSIWVEIKVLTTQTTKSVFTAAKELFATHGIPDIVISDNGPCFSAVPFPEFATKYGFVQTTSSPRFPQANREVERAVKTVKGLLKKNKDSLPCASHQHIYTPAKWSLTCKQATHGMKTADSASCPCKDIAIQRLKERV